VKSSAVILLSALSSLALAEPPPGGGMGIEHLPENLKPPVGKAVSDKDLKARQNGEKFGGFAEAGKEPKGWELEKNSEFITFDGVVTLVPKGAILHVPDRYSANVIATMTGKFVLWNEFSARYRSVVGGFEVAIAEASGQAEIKPERLEAARKTGTILVATMNQNPVSVQKKSPATSAATTAAR